MPVLPTNVANHRVLYGIQILELVDEHTIPARADAPQHVGVTEQVSRLEDEHVEVEHAALREELLVLLEDRAVSRVWERLIAETIGAKPPQQDPVPLRRLAQTSQHSALILLVSDAESRLEPDTCAELAEQLRAKGVDRSGLYLRR